MSLLLQKPMDDERRLMYPARSKPVADYSHWRLEIDSTYFA